MPLGECRLRAVQAFIMSDIPQVVPDLILLADHVAGYPAGIFVTPDVIGEIGEGTTEHFKGNAGVYDERYTILSEWTKDVLNRCAQIHPNFDFESVKIILDIGCGSGNATFSLQKAFPDAQIYATDISPDMVKILMERAQILG